MRHERSNPAFSETKVGQLGEQSTDNSLHELETVRNSVVPLGVPLDIYPLYAPDVEKMDIWTGPCSEGSPESTYIVHNRHD